MTILRTVALSEDQVAQFEKMAKEHGYDLLNDDEPSISEEIQNMMLERAKNWQPTDAISKDVLLKSFQEKGWDGK